MTGNVVRIEGERRPGLPWMNRLHADRGAIVIDDLPELLGDVFAWNKLFRRDFWDSAGLGWPERIRYEDQPCTTDAYLRAGRIGVTPEVVYHWRVRDDGTSITQQRATVADLADRWTTKRMALTSVEEYGVAGVTEVFRDRVLPGDMGQYFVNIPDCSNEWWDLLVTGVREFWGPQRSLTGSTLPPAQRLTGWLVEQDRRAEAALVSPARPGGPLPRVTDADGSVRVAVPGLDPGTMAPEALGHASGTTKPGGYSRAGPGPRGTPRRRPLGSRGRSRPGRSAHPGVVLSSAAISASSGSWTSGCSLRNSVETAGTRFCAGWMPRSSSSRTRPWSSRVPSRVPVWPSCASSSMHGLVGLRRRVAQRQQLEVDAVDVGETGQAVGPTLTVGSRGQGEALTLQVGERGDAIALGEVLGHEVGVLRRCVGSSEQGDALRLQQRRHRGQGGVDVAAADRPRHPRRWRRC